MKDAGSSLDTVTSDGKGAIRVELTGGMHIRATNANIYIYIYIYIYI